MYLLIYYGVCYGIMNVILEIKSNVEERDKLFSFNKFLILNRGCGYN